MSCMKPFMVVKEPEAFQLLADETRRKILYLLRVKEMTVSQLSSELGLTSQAVYSGRALALMPIGLLCILWFLNRDYVMTFFSKGNSLCGGIALGVAAILIVSGYFVMTRIGNVEV